MAVTHPGYEPYHVYYGDLHNHCEVGYGHGSIEDAYQNARLQLDFASVTAHALWPDMPVDEARLDNVVKYHQRGFERAARQWSHYLDVTRSENHDGQFVTFPSYEWHSIRYGDHVVYINSDEARIMAAPDVKMLRQQLRGLSERGVSAFMIPHHIGYKTGYRGIAWNDFDGEFSPVVEIFSMHGLAEGLQSPYPYLHTMGPVDERSSVQYGLRTGRVFGFIGSTDHHSAHPGSYGNGRVAVWAESLSRQAIWEAIAHRRTYALTGDRINLAFSLNGQPMGSALPYVPDRWIHVATVGGDAIDYVEVLHNNRIIERWNVFEQKTDSLLADPVKVLLELGWGEKGVDVDWQGHLTVENGQLLGVEPRFRGRDVLEPQAADKLVCAFSVWSREGASSLTFKTRTWGDLAFEFWLWIGKEVIEGNRQRLSKVVQRSDGWIGASMLDLAEHTRTYFRFSCQRAQTHTPA